MPRSDDDRPRSTLSVGIAWASRVTTIGLEFVVPTLLGVGIDRLAGSTPLATLLGALLGFSVGFAHLLRIAREGSTQAR